MTVQGRQAVAPLRTVGTFMAGRACSDTLFHVLSLAYEHPQPAEERGAQPLAGGILQRGRQCGMLWGAALAAGAEAHRRHGDGPRAEALAIAAAARLVEAFRRQHGVTDCVDLTELDGDSTTMDLVTFFLLKGGVVRCFAGAARFASAAKEAIDAALAEAPADAPPQPPSCAALLVRQLGGSGAHAVMAAGFAGGLGLGGGGCGALAAAVWLAGMRALEPGAPRLDGRSPAGQALLDRFLGCTGGELDCAAICGRSFEGVADHAAYLRGGGCARLLEVLASK